MNVQKFFRNQSRTLLMVFMAALLVVFLIGDVLQSLPSGGAGNQKIGRATAFGKTIYLSDVNASKVKLDICRMLGVPTPPVDELDFCLLEQEAQAMGIDIGREQAKDFIVDRLGERAEDLLKLARNRARAGYDDIYDAVADSLGVINAIQLQSLGTGASLARQRNDFRNQNQTAQVLCTAVDAEAFLSDVPEPTEAELTEFFEKYRDLEAGHTDDTIQFGYRLPDRIRVEMLTVDPRQIKAKVPIRGSETRRFYDQNQSRYMKRIETPTSDVVGPTSLPSSQPEMTIEQVPKTYEEALAEVRSDFREVKAIEEAKRLVYDIRSEAIGPWLNAERKDGFRVAPASIVSFKELQEKYSKRYPVQYRESDLLENADIRTFFGLRPPRSIELRMGADQLLFRVQGLYTPAGKDDVAVLSVNEPTDVLLVQQQIQPLGRQGDYQAYLLRVSEVVPAGPPTDMESLREQLVRDWKLAKAYELAGEAAERLAGEVREKDIFAGVAQATWLREKLGIPSSKDPATSQPSLTAAQEKYRRQLGPFAPSGGMKRNTPFVIHVGQVDAIPEQIFALDDAEDKVAVLPSARNFKWVVVEFKQLNPVYEGDFTLQRQRPQPDFESFRIQQRLYSSEGIRARAGFEMAGSGDEEEAQQAASR